MGALQVVTIFLRLLLQSRASLVAENLSLRQQVAVLQRSVKLPRLHRRDRIFWVWLSRLWRGWRSSLLVVQPETVIRWHRRGFRLYWRWKSRKRCGRPKLDAEIRALIRRMSRDNPTWGRRRIRSELHLLGYEVGELTVAKYMVRGGKPPLTGVNCFFRSTPTISAAVVDSPRLNREGVSAGGVPHFRRVFFDPRRPWAAGIFAFSWASAVR
jgi:hypothetical protein